MDSSDNFEIIGVLMLRSKDKEAWLRAFRDKKLHLRELKRADKRRISGRMLSLLRDGWKESHALCIITHVKEVRSNIRRQVKKYIPSSKLENTIRKAVFSILLEEVKRRIGAESFELNIDKEITLLAKAYSPEIKYVVGGISHLADIIAWSNLRRRDELRTRFKGAITEIIIRDRLEEHLKRILKIS